MEVENRLSMDDSYPKTEYKLTECVSFSLSLLPVNLLLFLGWKESRAGRLKNKSFCHVPGIYTFF